MEGKLLGQHAGGKQREHKQPVDRAIARDTAWKDYAAKSALSAELLKLAQDVGVS